MHSPSSHRPSSAPCPRATLTSYRSDDSLRKEAESLQELINKIGVFSKALLIHNGNQIKKEELDDLNNCLQNVTGYLKNLNNLKTVSKDILKTTCVQCLICKDTLVLDNLDNPIYTQLSTFLDQFYERFKGVFCLNAETRVSNVIYTYFELLNAEVVNHADERDRIIKLVEKGRERFCLEESVKGREQQQNLVQVIHDAFIVNLMSYGPTPYNGLSTFQMPPTDCQRRLTDITKQTTRASKARLISEINFFNSNIKFVIDLSHKLRDIGDTSNELMQLFISQRDKIVDNSINMLTIMSRIKSTLKRPEDLSSSSSFLENFFLLLKSLPSNYAFTMSPSGGCLLGLKIENMEGILEYLTKFFQAQSSPPETLSTNSQDTPTPNSLTQDEIQWLQEGVVTPGSNRTSFSQGKYESLKSNFPFRGGNANNSTDREEEGPLREGSDDEQFYECESYPSDREFWVSVEDITKKFKNLLSQNPGFDTLAETINTSLGVLLDVNLSAYKDCQDTGYRDMLRFRLALSHLLLSDLNFLKAERRVIQCLCAGNMQILNEKTNFFSNSIKYTNDSFKFLREIEDGQFWDVSIGSIAESLSIQVEAAESRLKEFQEYSKKILKRLEKGRLEAIQRLGESWLNNTRVQADANAISPKANQYKRMIVFLNIAAAKISRLQEEVSQCR